MEQNDSERHDSSGSLAANGASMVRSFWIAPSIFALCRHCGSQREVLKEGHLLEPGDIPERYSTLAEVDRRMI
jgi:hypothetical protein